MKFYDAGNTHNSLGHYVLYLLGGITTTDYPLTDMARATNTAKYDLALKTYRAQDSFDFDDGGHTDFPIATTTLVDNQQDYSLPTEFLELRRLEYKDANGDWFKIKEIDDQNIPEALDEFYETKGLPEYYRVEANSLILYPAPDTTLTGTTASLKATYSRDVNEFSASTTTTEVGFGSVGDRAIAFRVAEEWAGIHRPDRVQYLNEKGTRYEQEYLEHMSHRDRDGNPRLTVAYDDNE